MTWRRRPRYNFEDKAETARIEAEKQLTAMRATVIPPRPDLATP